MAFEITPRHEQERLRALYQKHVDQVMEHLAKNGPPQVRAALENWNPTAYAIEAEARRLKAARQEAEALPGQCEAMAEKRARERERLERRAYAQRERERFTAEQDRSNRNV